MRVLAISPAYLTCFYRAFTGLRVAHSGIVVALLQTGFGCMNKGSFGELLKRERELREVTLNEVTVATRIPPRFLEAFEREDWEKLPGGVFNRGFVRAIARYLGLDEESLLSEYDLAYGEQRATLPAVADNPIPAPPKWVVAAAFITILVLAVAAVWGSVHGWRRYAERRAAKRAALSASASTLANGKTHAPPSSTAAAPATAPHTALPTQQPAIAPTNPADPNGNPSAANATNSANPPPSQRLDLAVSTSGPTRVRVVADGRIVLDSRLPAGETRRLFAKNQFVVSAAHPEAVLLEMNGQAMPPLTSAGASGTMVLSQKDLRQAPSGNAQR
jgi:cytoskeleton protein RodZ